MITEIANLPDVSFIDNITLEDVQKQLMDAYQDKYEQLTGKKVTLQRGDPVTLILYACSVTLFQTLLYVDRAGKQDLLKYSYGGFLDNLAAYKGVTRNPAAAAVVTVRFTLSAVQTSVVSIPAGTRVTSGDGIYFQTDEYAEIAAGSTYTDVVCTCQEAGAAGNNLIPGEINILVDPIAYVDSVSNTDTSNGGADIEDDESLADRIYLAPATYSAAGPEEAYIQRTKSFSSSIGDVAVTTPAPCEVNVYVLLADGSLPSSALLSEIEDYLSAKQIRPLTDDVTALAPSTSSYNIDFTYYIAKSDQAKAATIQAEVAAAVDDYKAWQTRTIGRDVNPSELIRRVITAGAKRCVVNAPSFTVVSETTVARTGTVTVTYGGTEDD